jgi:hypothetical protein
MLLISLFLSLGFENFFALHGKELQKPVKIVSRKAGRRWRDTQGGVARLGQD